MRLEKESVLITAFLRKYAISLKKIRIIMLHSEIPHVYKRILALLCSPGLVSSPQIVDVDDESSFVLADHVPDFTLVNSLVLLQNTGNGDILYLYI